MLNRSAPFFFSSAFWLGLTAFTDPRLLGQTHPPLYSMTAVFLMASCVAIAFSRLALGLLLVLLWACMVVAMTAALLNYEDLGGPAYALPLSALYGSVLYLVWCVPPTIAWHLYLKRKHQ